ncbi:hypothetical protein EMPG_16464, partial [Blastomyces silverae]
MSSNTNNPQPQETTSTYLGQASNVVKNAVNTVTGSNTTDDKENKNETQSQTQPQTQPQPSGQYNQTVGSAKQSVGAAIGNENLRKAGERQNEE